MDDVYHSALKFIQRKSREEGFDAAMRYSTSSRATAEFDALLIFDQKGAGMQLAAQAGALGRYS